MGNKTRTYMNEFHPVLSGACLPISAYPFLTYFFFITSKSTITYINYIKKP